MAVLQPQSDAPQRANLAVNESTDPRLLSTQSSSLGSFCRRWELILMLRVDMPRGVANSRWTAVG